MKQLTLKELKELIKVKQKELDQLKKKRDEMELKSKEFHFKFMVHTINEMGEEKVKEEKVHHCGKSQLRELIRSAKHLSYKTSLKGRKKWYEMVDINTNQVLQVIGK